ncbi:MAG TPA: TetR/AcrR family transcriptional regulator [candidate division Zixibacteria bacterium]|nr:TetR/AcrR family transcriptional regulator [candidate division Zixibacteria bacterium]
MRRRELDKLRNKRLFLSSAEELFEQKGYSGTTIEEIAERAGFSKATIYNYFGGKDHLLVELIQEKFRSLLESANEIFSRENTLEEGIFDYITLSFEYFQRNTTLFRMMMADGMHHSELVHNIIHPNVFEGLQNLRMSLTAFFEKHRDKANPNIATEDLALMLMTMIGGYASEMGLLCKDFDIMSKRKDVLELFLHGAAKVS